MFYKKKYQFSFLELMVVIVIVTVMVAVAAPRFSSFYSSLRLDNNARQLKLFFTYARNTALSTRKKIRILYVAADQKFVMKIQKTKSKVADQNDNDGFDYEYEKYDEYFVNVDGIFKSLKLPEGIKLSSAQEVGGMPINGNVDFDFDIRPMGVENAYKFTLENDKGSSISVVIMAGSGVAKIFKKNTTSYYGE
jgi:type II secretory pathway pseudopilin PulG